MSRARWWLALVLLVQAGLSLRLRNTAFQDEALYLNAGRELADKFRSGIVFGDDPFVSFFSGSPYLYPLGAGELDDRYGLAAVRLVSLAAMLGATVLLYALTRRLAGPGAALGAAALFAVAAPTQMLGNFATYDAPALFALALTAWLAVRSGEHSWSLYPAAFTATLTVLLKYAIALYLPTVVLLAVLAAWHTTPLKALARGAAFAVGTAALTYVAFDRLHAFEGLDQTTTDRDHGSTTAAEIAELAVRWAGPWLVLAVAGVVIFTRAEGETPGRLRRLLLGALLVATALLAPLYHLYLRTDISLHKHVGFGLFFACAMAGVPLARLAAARAVGAPFAVGALTVAVALGSLEANTLYTAWPDTRAIGRTLEQVTPPGGWYLTEAPDLPPYYTRHITTQSRWIGPYYFQYQGVEGPEAYAKAMRDGFFKVIVLADPPVEGATDPTVDPAADPRYWRAGKFRARTSEGPITYEVWVVKKE